MLPNELPQYGFSGLVWSIQKIPYTNAFRSGLNGTLYTYDVRFREETLNYCVTNDDCGEGTTRNNCGCQCTPDNGIMNRCHTKWEKGNGEEGIIFRPKTDMYVCSVAMDLVLELSVLANA